MAEKTMSMYVITFSANQNKVTHGLSTAYVKLSGTEESARLHLPVF